MRLVDADSLKTKMTVSALGGHKQIWVCGVIDDAPTVDAQPVKHGKWVDIGHNAGLKCSNCGKRIRYRNGIKNEITVTDGRFNHTHEASQNGYFNFCPKCGSYN